MKMKPKIAVFDFASCEGCELQVANLEEEILELIDAVEVVSFREVMKEHSDDYDVAFIEGSINRPTDEERLREIRSRAKVLIALGDCACTGCVNKLRNDWSREEALEEVYPGAGKQLIDNEFFELNPARAVDEVVSVDFKIRGCPVRKEQVLYYIKRLSTMPPTPNKDLDYRILLRDMPSDDRSIVKYNPNKCILCRRCAMICQDVLGVDALGVVQKGSQSIISTPQNIGFDANGCIHCGQCISVCPVGALSNHSPVQTLAMEVGKKRLSIALDSLALASFVQKHPGLKTLPPELAERYVIAGLRAIGFRKVYQYDYFLSLSVQKDTRSEKPVLSSWCLAAQNYFRANGPPALEINEAHAPWNLLLEEEHKGICLLSPCSAMKSFKAFSYVLTAANLMELFKQLDTDLEFLDPDGVVYDGETVEKGFRHPGIPAFHNGRNRSFGITPDVKARLASATLNKGGVHVYPCLQGCVNGGGNHPGVDEKTLEDRINWFAELRGVT